ncbi:hypothetical protein ACJMK2_001591, partial [Sinanodonta woodiana]
MPETNTTLHRTDNINTAQTQKSYAGIVTNGLNIEMTTQNPNENVVRNSLKDSNELENPETPEKKTTRRVDLSKEEE